MNAASANPLRGEVELVLASGTLRLRPSFAALVAAEQELGSLPALLERVAGGDVRLADAAALLWHCRTGDAFGERAAFEAALAEAGLRRVLSAYRALLAAVFGGA